MINQHEALRKTLELQCPYLIIVGKEFKDFHATGCWLVMARFLIIKSLQKLPSVNQIRCQAPPKVPLEIKQGSHFLLDAH